MSKQVNSKNQMKNFLFLFFSSIILISGCKDSILENPSNQCLNSFKFSLKDPESGKVISFEKNILIYTATNSYGARIQGKAICIKIGEKWERHYSEEYVQTLTLVGDKIKQFNQCRRTEKKSFDCAGNSSALRNSDIFQKSIDLDLLHKEAAEELGFN